MESGKEESSYIIAMTANAREEDRRECLDVGMNDFISKPVQLTELEKAINKALGKIDALEGAVEEIMRDGIIAIWTFIRFRFKI